MNEIETINTMSYNDAATIVKDALELLMIGDPFPVENRKLFFAINDLATIYLGSVVTTPYQVEVLGDLLRVANIIYNNFPIDDDNLFLDNGVYDLLLEKYREHNPNVPIGAPPIQFKYETPPQMIKKNTVQLVRRIDAWNTMKDPLFKDNIMDMMYPPLNNGNLTQLVTRVGHETGKKLRVTGHNYPELVGTLLKCKFVLDKQAEEAEVLDDPKVKVFERDFIAMALKKGVISPNIIFQLLGEFKYDGVSVVVHISKSIVVSAISRGDTGMDAAVDYTPIMYGYVFPDVPEAMELEVKCEAVMTYKDLYEFSQLRGYDYKNPRSAIIGLTGLNNGYKYRDFITLVPLKVVCTNEDTEPEFDVLTLKTLLGSRQYEMEFIQTTLAKNIFPSYVVFEGDITSILFQVNKFVEETKAMREYMPVMYDGVVISFIDQRIIEELGRENYTNQWQMAIKYPTLKRETTLLGITFTVGQNGVITPMAHYQPIEFLGTVHTKSSISSVKRFKEGEFKVGDMIQVEYINDVIPYVSVPSHLREINRLNPEALIEFPTKCPMCGSELEIGEKSARCNNVSCRGRVIARMSNMMKKLGIKGFAEESMAKLNVSSLEQLCSLPISKMALALNSAVVADNLNEQLMDLVSTDRYDYELLGALGFTNVAQDTWRIIFKSMTFNEFIEIAMHGDYERLYDVLISIHGIGKVTAETICNELPHYISDIKFLYYAIKQSYGIEQKKIRITGVRDSYLMEQLKSKGYDASDKGVTKDTFILLIPYEGFTSSKTSKVGPDTKVIPIMEFKQNMDKYLQ